MRQSWQAWRGLTAVVVALVAAESTVGAQAIQQGTVRAQLKLVTTVTSASGGAPNFGVHSGNNRFLYVGEQNGRVRTLDFTQQNPLLGTNFLDIDTALPGTLVDDTNTGERGLLGAAFHPGFNGPSNGSGYRKFYTFTSEVIVNGTPHFAHQTELPAYNHHSVVREWTAGAPNANGVTAIDPAVPSRVVMRVARQASNHNGGGMTFGGDGYLYVALGDGGAGDDGGYNSNNNGFTNPGNPDAPGAWTGQGNGQDRRNVYGKILRIKPTTDADPNTNPGAVGGGYRVPKSNPFTPDANPANPADFVDEIYAYGFRNPFRISFDAANPDRLYAADVGQNRDTFSREEVSSVTAGGNYGWVAKSGNQINTDASSRGYTTTVPLIDPLAQYPTTANGSGGTAAIGGFVYRGDLLPELFGRYVFGDLSRDSTTLGRLLYTDLADPALTVYDFLLDGGVAKPNSRLHGVAEGADREIYFLFGNGQVMALVPEPSAVALLGFAALAALGRRRRRNG